MRNALINFLTKEASKNDDLILITGDLGFGVFENFKKNFPNQFFNAGISEQNMTSMACGLAIEGCKVFTYSIGNFSTLRCLEQIRNDVCYHNADVTIVTVGAGFSYGQLGISHFATEDISIMRAIPNISIFSPCNPWETTQILEQIKKKHGPKYLRIDKRNANTIEGELILGIPRKCFDGEDAIIFATGGIVDEAIKVAQKFREMNKFISVYSVHTLKPIETKNIVKLIENTKAVFTIEEHTEIGGLGSIISEIIAENSSKKKIFKRFGIQDKFPEVVGDQDYLRKLHGLEKQSIFHEINSLMKE